MPATYEPIATTTLGSAATQLEFTSIPGTYTDLVLIVVSKSAASFMMRVNGSSSSIYSVTTLGGNGTSAVSQQQSNQTEIEVATYSGFTDATNPKFAKIDLFSYAGSTNKTFLIECNLDRNGSGGLDRKVGLFRSTSAITSIRIYSATTNGLYADTTATLYGITKA